MFTAEEKSLSTLVFTARKRSLGQGNIFSSVCQEFCSQGGGLPQCMLGYHPPRSRHPPPNQAPPWTKHPPAGRYGQQAGGMHPTGMQSCLFMSTVPGFFGQLHVL